MRFGLKIDFVAVDPYPSAGRSREGARHCSCYPCSLARCVDFLFPGRAASGRSGNHNCRRVCGSPGHTRKPGRAPHPQSARKREKMSRISKLIFVEFALSAVASAALLCTPSNSVAGSGEIIHVTAYDPDGLNGVQYSWTVTGGTVQGHGAEADWTLSDVKPMTAYSVKVVAKDKTTTARNALCRWSPQPDARRPRNWQDAVGPRQTGRTRIRPLQLLTAWLAAGR